jgi:zinc/manganese transport system permease protein
MSPAVPEVLHSLLGPFIEFGFMRRALVTTLALAVSFGPIGAFLQLRRMSLIGDAMAHAIFPGVAAGFMIAGFSLAAMTLGGLVAGLAVALAAGAVTRYSAQREETSFAAFYLLATAAGVILVTAGGMHVDLMHLLFGAILAVSDASLLLVVSVASASLIVLAIIYRPLVVESFDPEYLRSVAGSTGARAHFIFSILVVLNLVAGFQALGTVMAVGLMVLPAAAARLWVRDVSSFTLLTTALAVISGLAGLLLSYHLDLPSGPTIVIATGGIYVVSVLFGTEGSLYSKLARRPHLAG